MRKLTTRTIFTEMIISIKTANCSFRHEQDMLFDGSKIQGAASLKDY